MIRLQRALALIAVCCCLGASRPFDAGRYGSVQIAQSEGQARAFVIYFSGRNGLSAADETAVATMVRAGAFVAEVNSKKYLDSLDEVDEPCHALVYDAELLSRQLQRDNRFPNYLTPIVAGVGEGGTLAEIILAQAPSATVAGAVAIDPSATLTSRQPMCSDVSKPVRPAGFRYGPPKKKLQGFWTIGLTSQPSTADRGYVMSLRHAGAPIELHEIAAGTTVGDALLSMIEPHLARPGSAVANTPTVTDISGLPLAELPVDHPSGLMAVFLSGDGGWRDLDKTLAEDVQRRGVPVVGLDSLRYFWSKKTPEQTANLVATLIRTFMGRWHANRVALIGYSFGADVMPFAYNRLPESLRAHVVLIALLGLAKSADFQISVGSWLGEGPGPDALPVVPEASKIPSQLMQCFYGRDEADTACPALARRGVQTFPRNGGHHFDGNYGTVAELILAGFNKRAGLSLGEKASASVSRTRADLLQ